MPYPLLHQTQYLSKIRGSASSGNGAMVDPVVALVDRPFLAESSTLMGVSSACRYPWARVSSRRCSQRICSRSVPWAPTRRGWSEQ